MIAIRSAEHRDLHAMTDLFVGVIRSVCSAHYHPAQIEVWAGSAQNSDRWKKSITNDLFLVAETGIQIVGFASLAGNEYIDFLYVHKDHQRKGIAQGLYERLENEAVENKVGRLTSDVSITAKPFFMRNGFTTVQENRNMIQGVEIINYRMHKELRSI